jgi:hypothetical protein
MLQGQQEGYGCSTRNLITSAVWKMLHQAALSSEAPRRKTSRTGQLWPDPGRVGGTPAPRLGATDEVLSRLPPFAPSSLHHQRLSAARAARKHGVAKRPRASQLYSCPVGSPHLTRAKAADRCISLPSRLSFPQTALTSTYRRQQRFVILYYL